VLDPRRLSVLLAIREHGGISSAARTLAFSPSAVSQQIAALERQLGVDLVDRTRRRARLTTAGHRLADHAEGVLGLLAAAETEVSGLSDAVGGTVGLGTIATLARTAVPGIVAELAHAAPQLRLWVEQVDRDKGVAAVRRGDLDLVVVDDRWSDEADAAGEVPTSVEVVPVMSEPLVVAVPRAHHTTGGKIALADLRGEQWIAISGGEPSRLELAARSEGFEPIVTARVSDVDVALHLVRAGVGVSLVPESAARPRAHPPGVRFVAPIRPVHRAVVAFVRRGGLGSPTIALVLSLVMDSMGRRPARQSANTYDV
jgi:molybdate transport repressor ModE-like protein